jgi:hypothetical protein
MTYAAAAVALLLGWLVIGVVVPGARRTIADGAGENDFLSRMPLFPPVGFAQAVSDTLRRASYPLLDRLPETHPSAGSWRYEATLTVDGRVTTPQGTRTFTIDSAVYRSEPVWIIVTEGRGTYARSPFRDTLIVAQRDLRVLRRAAPAWVPFTLNAATDTVAPFLSWRYADVGWLGTVYRALFQLQPLERAWRGSVYLPWRTGTHGERVSYYPLDLHVDGEERVSVPAGSFDAWRVAVHGRRSTMTVWVSKSSHWVLKIAIPSGADAVWEQALASATSPP